jgi:hypothetical protein
MSRSVSKILCLVAAAFISMAAPGSARATPATAAIKPPPPGHLIAPHKALYEIALVSKKSGSQVVDIHGKMYFAWNTGCDAWTTDHRFQLYYSYADSAPLRIDSAFSTYEPYDGKSFSFNARRSRNGDLFEELSGSAAMDAKGGHVDYAVPKDMGFTLKPGTLFPMLHTVDLIGQAMTGHKFFNAVVFDGSDDEGPVEINSFIGRRMSGLDMAKPGAHMDKALLDVPAWKIRMAFFPVLHPETEPEYEMDAVLQQNGVISFMRVEYKDFTVTQTLVALEPLNPAECSGKTPEDRGGSPAGP